MRNNKNEVHNQCVVQNHRARLFPLNSRSMEKSVFHELVSGAKKVGEPWVWG